MKSLKGIVIISTIVAAAAVLAACRGSLDEPLSFGAGDAAIAGKAAR
jgi:cyclic lactone autoinducer peptide